MIWVPTAGRYPPPLRRRRPGSIAVSPGCMAITMKRRSPVSEGRPRRTRNAPWPGGGIGYSAGPNYNKPWEAFDEDDARRSLATAFEASGRALLGRGPGEGIRRGSRPDLGAPAPLPIGRACGRHVSLERRLRGCHARRAPGAWRGFRHRGALCRGCHEPYAMGALGPEDRGGCRGCGNRGGDPGTGGGHGAPRGTG